MKIDFIPAIIFAGGKSRRMGRDKSLLPFGDFSTLTEYQFDRLSKIFTTVFISSKENKFDFVTQQNLENILILDEVEKYSVFAPTLGLFSVMNFLKNRTDFKYFMILSVDSPFFGEKEISKLIEELEKNPNLDLVIAKIENGLEPLLSIYSVNLISQIEEMLKTDNHKLNFFIRNYDSNRKKEVIFSDLEAFENLNFFEEYQKYQK